MDASVKPEVCNVPWKEDLAVSKRCLNMQKEDYAVSLKGLFYLNPASNQNYNLCLQRKIKTWAN